VRNFDASDTQAKKFGRALHLLMLEGEEVFAKHFTIKEKVKGTTEAGKLGQGEWDTARILRDEILAHPVARLILKGAKTEVTMLATVDVMRSPDQQQVDVVPVRCRHDIWKQGYSADLKFVQSITKAEIGKTIANYRYGGQAAFYLDIMAKCDAGLHQNFITIFVEKEAPHKILCVTYPDMVLEAERQRNADALARFTGWLEKYGTEQRWPDFEPRIYDVWPNGTGDGNGIELPTRWDYL
jgi:hypothetical protein